jgi:hypothetical protein
VVRPRAGPVDRFPEKETAKLLSGQRIALFSGFPAHVFVAIVMPSHGISLISCTRHQRTKSRSILTFSALCPMPWSKIIADNTSAHHFFSTARFLAWHETDVGRSEHDVTLTSRTSVQRFEASFFCSCRTLRLLFCCSHHLLLPHCKTLSVASIACKLMMQNRIQLLFISFATTALHLITVGSRALPKVALFDDSSFTVENSSESLKTAIPSSGQISVTNLDYDLSIVITSNLIPTHPKIDFINRTITSLSHINGLPFDTPIYVTVDALPKILPHNEGQRHVKDRRRLSRYIQSVKDSSFWPFTNIQVLVMDQHQHISGSVNEAIKYISNSTQYHFSPENHYVYLLQHDLYFIEPIPHQKLIGAMREAPDQLRNIRFRYNRNPKDQSNELDAYRFPPCYNVENGTVFERHGLPFYATSRWSDNNQLSTLEYYQNMITHIRNTTKGGRMNLPMEWVLMSSANANCRQWGQAVLGDRQNRRSYLGHMDGRRTKGMTRRNN